LVPSSAVASPTHLRATLIAVADNQNITPALPSELLRQIKRVADEDRRFSAARKRALAAIKSARSLGTRGHQTWTRDDLHDR
jgi:hypothetical protein